MDLLPKSVLLHDIINNNNSTQTLVKEENLNCYNHHQHRHTHDVFDYDYNYVYNTWSFKFKKKNFIYLVVFLSFSLIHNNNNNNNIIINTNTVVRKMVDVLEQKYQNQLNELRTQIIERIGPNIEEIRKNSNHDETTTQALQFLESAFQTNSNQELDLEDLLIKYIIILDATPKGLAEFVLQNESVNRKIVDEDLLQNNTKLCKEMVLADGPSRVHVMNSRRNDYEGPAYYGQAMKIYKDIQNESEYLNDNTATNDDITIFHKLAVAVALEHAVPILQSNPKEKGGGFGDDDDDDDDDFEECIVDPVKRYLNYELAYLNGELDPNFDKLSIYELRLVVDGDEPDEISSWGRTMLRNYRPDTILMNNMDWRYSEFVRTNIRYGSQDCHYDKNTLQYYQNILMNGGICGRRAFFGRFILRAFGIPTMGHPTRGHGALCRWSGGPNCWTVNLGPGWGHGWTTKTYYNQDTDFLSSIKARQHEEEYWNVKRAQWIGDLLGEKRIYGDSELQQQQEKDGGDDAAAATNFWNKLSLKIQKTIIERNDENNNKGEKKKENDDETTATKVMTMMEKLLATPVKKESITYNDQDGCIVVPSSAYSSIQSKNDVLVMRSFDEEYGQQLYMAPFYPQGESIIRGGSYKNDETKCRTGARGRAAGMGKYPNFGFRVAVSIPTDEDVHNDDDGGTGTCRPESDGTWRLRCDDETTLELVYIKPGTFIMGGNKDTETRFECIELPEHTVQLTKGYYMGKYPVTQAQFKAVMGLNPSKSTIDPNCPVDDMAETDCRNFCDKLSEITGQDVRLPTEAEWEYACRGGTTSTYFWGEDPARLPEYAWCIHNSGKTSHPVGQLLPNPFGLYDMIGNVIERVADRYEGSYFAKCAEKGTVVDPTGANPGKASIVEYKIKVPKSCNYAITALVVTANEKQRLRVSTKLPTSSKIPEDDEGQIINLPFTLGLWQETEPVILHLEEGETTLRFWRDKPPQYGIAIKKFTIKPV